MPFISKRSKIANNNRLKFCAILSAGKLVFNAFYLFMENYMIICGIISSSQAIACQILIFLCEGNKDQSIIFQSLSSDFVKEVRMK